MMQLIVNKADAVIAFLLIFLGAKLAAWVLVAQPSQQLGGYTLLWMLWFLTAIKLLIDKED